MKFDVVLVGGGLACGLIAFRLTQRRPDLSIVIIENQATLGGKHTWSFFGSDLTPQQRQWLEPFIVYRWPQYDVRFPRGVRRLDTWYHSITSERFNQVLTQLVGQKRLHVLRADVQDVYETYARLDTGERVVGRLVIDGRGPEPAAEFVLAYQKFFGRVVECDAPHGVEVPIVMDATVPQVDGYRFLYTLPLNKNTLLVEDTRYTDEANFDRDAMRASIEEYIALQSWGRYRVLSEEEGLLPIALDGAIGAFWQHRCAVPRVGLRAALYHPTTGYSLPDAMNIAELLAEASELTSPAIHQLLMQKSIQTWQSRSFFRMVNRMLFHAARPDRRFVVLQRFYQLPKSLIERFFAAKLTLFDCARILIGKPPVPLHRAIRAMRSECLR